MTDSQAIAQELNLPPKGVSNALTLFDDGATVPFVARYRKEATGGLDEVALRAILDAQTMRQELAQRRQTILKAMAEQNQLTDALKNKIENATTKTALEDLYAPYKKRRKTRGDTAIEKGLKPLAQRILDQPRHANPNQDAKKFVRPDKGVNTIDEALAGARDIVAETLAFDPKLKDQVRDAVSRHGVLKAKAAKKDVDVQQFKDYINYEERGQRVPSHRYLAVCRGEAEGVLSVSLKPDLERTYEQLLRRCKYFPTSPFGGELAAAAKDALKRLIMPSAERSTRAEKKVQADDDAIDVFQKNLEALLLAAPYGPQKVLGIDPGIRTGCKCAMVSAQGELLEYQTLYLVGQKNVQTAPLLSLLKKHRPEAVAVGNGTGGRETESLLRSVVKDAGLDTIVVSVNEAGASVYSASDIAREEFPDLDLTVRGAVSIARRLQDPLSELVKVPPKSIGVGQYQHDVDQGKLERRLGQVVETCVNRVGVDLNTASPALLSHVAGIGPKLADAVVKHRYQHQKFRSRKELLKVAGLGPKTFEQCAGFLRINGGTEPLDASAVHPERYGVVKRMAKDLGVSVSSLLSDERLVDRIELSHYQTDDVGRATLTDIIAELKKPGRDPRADFEPPAFRDDVHDIADLKTGMTLSGVVTNVTNFGAFVDIGVHQDGLVHISELANRFVSSPHDVVSAGQKISVVVLDIDVKRRRISLSAKAAERS